MIVRFIDIVGMQDHHCSSFLFIIRFSLRLQLSKYNIASLHMIVLTHYTLTINMLQYCCRIMLQMTIFRLLELQYFGIITLYYIFCCNMFHFSCPIIARSQSWSFVLKYSYLLRQSTSCICSVVSQIACQGIRKDGAQRHA